MNLRLIFLSFAFCLLSFISMAQAPAPKGYTLRQDVVYSQIGDWKGRVDLYLPDDSKTLHPLVIFVHGGGWVHGKKEEETQFIPFFSRNCIVANVEYRLADQGPAPAAIQDVRTAMAWLARRSDSLHIDTRKVILMGPSAGGHLVLMAGLLGKDHHFDTDKRASDLRIVGIIDRYGPTDLMTYDIMFKLGKASSAWLGDHGRDTAFIRSISPVNYVRKSSPPIMIIHGDHDNTVPIEQSKELVAAVQKAGGRVEMYTVEGGKHGKFPASDNEKIEPKMLEFADSCLHLNGIKK